jgi:hypothetical protein
MCAVRRSGRPPVSWPGRSGRDVAPATCAQVWCTPGSPRLGPRRPNAGSPPAPRCYAAISATRLPPGDPPAAARLTRFLAHAGGSRPAANARRATAGTSAATTTNAPCPRRPTGIVFLVRCARWPLAARRLHSRSVRPRRNHGARPCRALPAWIYQTEVPAGLPASITGRRLDLRAHERTAESTAGDGVAAAVTGIGRPRRDRGFGM